MDSECHSMVIEYLIHNCFKNTAKALISESSRLENYTSLQQKGNIKKGVLQKGIFYLGNIFTHILLLHIGLIELDSGKDKE
jgi:hypothetical protein